jgi:hypothetical protein
LGHSLPLGKTFVQTLELSSARQTPYCNRVRIRTISIILHVLDCTGRTDQGKLSLSHMFVNTVTIVQSRQSQWFVVRLPDPLLNMLLIFVYISSELRIYVRDGFLWGNACWGVFISSVPFSRQSFLILGQYQELSPEPHTLSFTIDTTTTLTPVLQHAHR